jgi:hypothetical protein
MKLGPWKLPEPEGPYEWERLEDQTNGDLPKRAIHAAPRMGKTNAIALTLRRRAGAWRRALVTAPLKVGPTWKSVLGDAGIPTHELYDLSGLAAERFVSDPAWEGVAIINRDKLANAAFAGVPKLDVFVADESHNYCGISTDRGRAYRKLARTTPYVRSLTGTPAPRHYGSLWSQLAPLDPDNWPSSYERFAQRFLVRDAMYTSRVLAHINVDELQAMILKVAAIYRREDWFGKDRYQEIHRTVEMPARAWNLYHRLAKEWVLQSDDWATITATNAAVRLMRLQQLTSGFLPDLDADGTTKGALPMHQAKIDALIADMDEIVASDEKIVVFHRFVHEGEVAATTIGRAFPDMPVFRLGRGTGAEDIEAFNAFPGAAAIVVQMQSGSEGVSLREGRHLAYLSRTFSFTDDEQSRDRVYKHDGSAPVPRTITYYDVDGTVDAFVANLLADKRDLHESLRNADRESLVFGRIRRKRAAA